MDGVEPYCGRDSNRLLNCSSNKSSRLILDGKPDLVDPHTTAHRAQASEVCSAASAVVKGGVSAKRRAVESHKRQKKYITWDKNLS